MFIYRLPNFLGVPTAKSFSTFAKASTSTLSRCTSPKTCHTWVQPLVSVPKVLSTYSQVNHEERSSKICRNSPIERKTYSMPIRTKSQPPPRPICLIICLTILSHEWLHQPIHRKERHSWKQPESKLPNQVLPTLKTTPSQQQHPTPTLACRSKIFRNYRSQSSSAGTHHELGLAWTGAILIREVHLG